MCPSVSHRVNTVKINEQWIPKLSVATSQLTGWVYWQREPQRSPNCWTKVFAVLDNAFLWLFQREESAPHSLLVQIAVADVHSEGEHLLRVIDSSGEELCISLCDIAAFECWNMRLKEAAGLTAAFFRSSGLDVQDLPRWSNYRGTLEDYHRVSVRAKCKEAVAQITRWWRNHRQLCKYQDTVDIEAIKNDLVKSES